MTQQPDRLTQIIDKSWETAVYSEPPKPQLRPYRVAVGVLLALVVVQIAFAAGRSIGWSGMVLGHNLYAPLVSDFFLLWPGAAAGKLSINFVAFIFMTAVPMFNRLLHTLETRQLNPWFYLGGLTLAALFGYVLRGEASAGYVLAVAAFICLGATMAVLAALALLRAKRETAGKASTVSLENLAVVIGAAIVLIGLIVTGIARTYVLGLVVGALAAFWIAARPDRRV